MKIEVVGNQKSLFGEGILWDAEEETVLWVDLSSSQILAYSQKTKEESSIQLLSPATSILKYKEGEYLLIMSRQINHLNTKTRELSEYISFEWMDPLLLLNDAKIDNQGRIWTGSVDTRFKEFRESDDTAFHEYEPKIGHIYMVDHDLSVKTFNYPVGLSNGLAFHPTEPLLYHVDSATQSIWRYEIDMMNTNLINQGKVYEFNLLEGFPDGMTIDEDGMLWTAIFKSRKIAQKTKKNGYVAQINPKTNELIQKIEFPIYHVTSCQFGGLNMNELFITTAFDLLDEQDRKDQLVSGSLLKLMTSTKGIVQHSIQRYRNNH